MSIYNVQSFVAIGYVLAVLCFDVDGGNFGLENFLVTLFCYDERRSTRYDNEKTSATLHQRGN